MTPLALYCKSYSTDLNRVKRLAESVSRYNAEAIPFYVSVSERDLPLFRDHLAGLPVNLLADEAIVQASPGMRMDQLMQMPGSVSQQVIKSEFWRLGLCNAYLCLDSDAFFIRPFSHADFLAADGTPYTMVDEAHDVLEAALLQRRPRIVQAFEREADLVQSLFQRPGRRYSFGPFPLVWHRAVWQSLEQNYLIPHSMTFADAISQAPIESRWYGEALLAYQAIRLLPAQALFKVYHYAWQKDQDFRKGMNLKQLSTLYCGVIYQSAWERDMDWPSEGGSLLSLAGRRLRRRLGRI
jgi:hypothetical protein